MTVSRSMNREVLSLSKGNQLGFEKATQMASQNKELFSLFLEKWMISDTIASYFVFDLSGFEYLLDIVGEDEQQPVSGDDDVINTSSIPKPLSSNKVEDFDSLSDIKDMIFSTLDNLKEVGAPESDSVSSAVDINLTGKFDKAAL